VDTSVRIETIQFKSGDRRLAGSVFRPRPKARGRPALLFIHGFKSSQARYRPRAVAVSLDLGAVCMTFDLGGHGESEGVLEDLGTGDHFTDALAAFDVLSGDDEVDAGRMGACGASYGGYLAALLVSERPVKRLLLRAPALHADDDADVPTSPEGSTQAGARPNAALASLNAFDGEFLVVESERDCVISPAVIEKYVKSSPRASRVLIRGAAHNLEPRFDEQFVEIIRDWFRAL
jgi:pimeloyl-ACP methyl ester carboxylesterase